MSDDCFKLFQHSCYICDKVFSQASVLYRHIRNVHKLETIFPSGSRSISCSMCPSDRPSFNTLKQLENHMQETHQVDFRREKHEFHSLQEFQDWKLNMEKETSAKFVQANGAKRTSDSKRTVFYCNRSGHYVPSGTGKRALKAQGSCKIEAHCPSGMTVLETGSSSNLIIKVEFNATHVGHKLELGHLTLQKQEKDWIAAQLSSGIDMTKILHNVRQSLDNQPERKHLLTRKDLTNIEAAYKINTAVRHSSDRVSVDSWVKGMEDDLNNPILLYKPQGEQSEFFPELKSDDFCLVLMNTSQEEMLNQYGRDCVTIDTTHGMNEYGFNLTTIMVLDDLRAGFPCAFMFSNREDECVFSVFLKLIKQQVGVIVAHVFMSDMAEAFYNAWKIVMGEVAMRLLCTWHVDRAWRKNLTKIEPFDKRISVYHVLRTLLHETDSIAFEHNLSEALKQLREDEETQTFADYFEAEYICRKKEWAYCYRLNAGLNTNMHLESMHKTIKYIYLQGKKVKRLDKSIHALMSFLQDRIFDRLVTIHKGKVTKKMSSIRKSHQHSLKLSSDSVVNVGDGTWYVQSQTNVGELYEVSLVKSECTCALICKPCNACLHKYRCQCLDSSVKWNMCKHIHLICQSLQNTTSIENDSTVTTNSEEHNGNLCIDLEEATSSRALELEAHVNHLRKESASKEGDHLQKLKEELVKDCEYFLSKINQSQSVEQLKEMRSLLNPVKSTVDVIFMPGISVKNVLGPLPLEENICLEPANKKIVKQRFFSTRKKCKKKKKTLAKPSCQEVHSIACALTLGGKVMK